MKHLLMDTRSLMKSMRARGKMTIGLRRRLKRVMHTKITSGWRLSFRAKWIISQNVDESL